MAGRGDTTMARQWWVSCAVADLRAEPHEQAERVSQLVFLTPCDELESSGGWRKVRGPDGYEGWIRATQTCLTTCSAPKWKISHPFVVVQQQGTGQILGWLALDTRVPGDLFGNRILIPWPDGRIGFVLRPVVKPLDWIGTLREFINYAHSLVGIPYLWGGTTPFGFDCSGLVQRLVHFVFNRWIPRDSRDQREQGVRIHKLSQLEPGDLLFFPGHVGIWLGEGRILHASASVGQVTVTLIDPPEGAYAQELREQFLWGVRLASLVI